MPKHIATESGDLTIEIGTRDDDKRIAPTASTLTHISQISPVGAS